MAGALNRACPRAGASIVHRASGRAVAATCGAWSCSRCGSRKRDKLARRGAALKPDGMMTLTISDRYSDGLDAASPEALAFLQERARVFMRHINRVFGRVVYLWVYETGEKNGRWHRHYLWRWRGGLIRGRRGWIPKHMLRQLQDFAKSAGLGRLDWRPCNDDRRASGYVAKYVTKTLSVIAGAASRRFRRFGSNEHYEERKEEGWRFVRASVEVAQRALEAGPERAASRVYWLLDDGHLPNRAPPHGVVVGTFPVGITKD